MRRYLGQLGLLLVVILPRSAAGAQGTQSGKFDLDKTKEVVSGLVEKTLAENGIPSMSIVLVRGGSVVWKAAFCYANMRIHTPASTETLYSTGSSFKSSRQPRSCSSSNRARSGWTIRSTLSGRESGARHAR